MKRYKLIDARKRRGLNQSQLGKALGDIPRDSVASWEDGTSEPRPDMIQALCDYFGCTFPYELDLHSAFNVPTQCREDELLQMLERLDRRQLIALFSKLSVFAGVDLTVLFSATLIAPDNLLSLCETVINECWLMMGQGSFPFANTLLSECISKLDGLATKASPFQQEAASLAVDARIIQTGIANSNMNYKRSVTMGESAIRYGELSGDNNKLIASLGWHGNTYIGGYNQPEIAVSILSKALPLFDSHSPLNQADISISLARAYALDSNETKSRDYVDMALSAMPEQPELDPQYRMIDMGTSELDQRVGNVYLTLVETFPTQKAEYGQLAYDALVKSVSQAAISNYQSCQSLIRKADAARVIGEKDGYLDSLMEGANTALQLKSERQITEAVKLLNETPRNWRTEQKYKELCGLLTPNPTK